MSDCRFGVSPVNYPDPDPDLGLRSCQCNYRYTINPRHDYSSLNVKDLIMSTNDSTTISIVRITPTTAATTTTKTILMIIIIKTIINIKKKKKKKKLIKNRDVI